MKILLYALLTLIALGMAALRVSITGWYLILFMGLIDLAALAMHFITGHRLIARTNGQFAATDWLAFVLMNGLYFLFFVCQADGGDTGGTTLAWENAFTDYLYENNRWTKITTWSGIGLLLTYGWILFFRK